MEMKEWVRTARAKGGFTLERLGEAMGRTKANVHAWEKGSHEPSVGQFFRLARLTRMDPAELDDWPVDFRVVYGETGKNDSKGEDMNGWPLQPELLAALQNADPKALKRAEVALMSALGFDIEFVRSAQETKRDA